MNPRPRTVPKGGAVAIGQTDSSLILAIDDFISRLSNIRLFQAFIWRPPRPACRARQRRQSQRQPWAIPSIMERVRRTTTPQTRLPAAAHPEPRPAFSARDRPTHGPSPPETGRTATRSPEGALGRDKGVPRGEGHLRRRRKAPNPRTAHSDASVPEALGGGLRGPRGGWNAASTEERRKRYQLS